MGRLLSFQTWLVLSIIWAGAMAYLCIASWPEVPLDISAIDPATVVALRAAIIRHAGLYALLAIGPPVLLFVLGRGILGRKT
ncbi:MAG TPA: hypothetical protein VJ045_09065 [Hyphomicrobiaceae bacterium]|nr:hypothetical protein [Hyphomicrobiaceae bacterium]